jgi:hypothetical protein
MAADDPKAPGPLDAARINVHEESDIHYWCSELGCTPEQLRAGVKAAGVLVDDVRRHLKDDRR